MPTKFEAFAALHVPGDPVVLYNIWDAGSARAVAAAGAKALATGSHPVGDASGFGDGQKVPLEFVFDNSKRIMAAVDLPLTVDFEGAYSVDPKAGADNVARLAETGAVGCNLEDQVVGGDGLHPTDRQVERLRAARAATGEAFFINARTDLFLKARREEHDEALVGAALARADAYAEAGASGIFVPGLADLRLFERFCGASPLPVNFMAFPGCPEPKQIASAGAARISHGPFPYKLAMKALKQAAEAAFGN